MPRAKNGIGRRYKTRRTSSASAIEVEQIEEEEVEGLVVVEGGGKDGRGGRDRGCGVRGGCSGGETPILVGGLLDVSGSFSEGKPDLSRLSNQLMCPTGAAVPPDAAAVRIVKPSSRSLPSSLSLRWRSPTAGERALRSLPPKTPG